MSTPTMTVRNITNMSAVSFKLLLPNYI